MEITTAVLDIVLLQENPSAGITTRQIIRQCHWRMSSQQLRWHLKKLKDLNLIHSKKDPTHRMRLLYFPGVATASSSKVPEKEAIPALIVSATIANTIAKIKDGITFRSLLAQCRLGISPHQMVAELRELQARGLIYFDYDPKHKGRFIYFPTPLLLKEQLKSA